MTSVWAPRAFHLLVKPRGPICNLNCEYCYFLSKERLYPGSDFRMSETLLEEYVRQYIEAQDVNHVTWAWQGGEPLLMGLPFFEEAVRLQDRYRRPGMTYEHSLQTNGTLLDDEWCRFFRERRFLIGLSLDGPQDVHDAHRKDKGGAGSWERVMRGLRRLQSHGVEYNILCTVHDANEDRGIEVYRFLRDDCGARHIQFIPIVERDNESGFQEGERVTSRSVSSAGYGRFLIEVFDEWVRRDVGTVYVQTFDVALAKWAGEPGGLCVFEETCGAALVMEDNGDVYSCDHFVEPAHLLGNIRETPLRQLARSNRQYRFGVAKRDTLPRFCRECDVRFACHGECPKNRLLATPEGEPGLNYLCEGLKAFFHHVREPMEFMRDQLRLRRPPAAVMAWMAQRDAARNRRFPEVGRNDPCPCGSGRKYKVCHGRGA
jgi:uncharacterized protein